MPDRAVLVMGGLTMPKPMPKIAYEANNQLIEVMEVNPDSKTVQTAQATPAVSSGNCGPRFETILRENETLAKQRKSNGDFGCVAVEPTSWR